MRFILHPNKSKFIGSLSSFLFIGSHAPLSMRDKLPKPEHISLGLALLITIAFAIFNMFVPKLGLPWFKYVLSFGLIFMFTYFALKWFFFQKVEDATVSKQMEIQKLKDMETFRREFLGDVSHELKTPIFAVQGFIHTLLDGAMHDERVREKFLKKALKNANRLSNLVHDLLIITQIESGELQMELRAFSMHELITDVVDSLEYKIQQKNIQINILPGEHKEVQVLADRERIQQVLTNLVDNSIKYGNTNGNIEIDMKMKGKKLNISVRDDGPGIEQTHLDKVFRRFYRIDKSRSRDKGGTGLGLAICKHFMEAHNEAIWVESRLGAGSTFTFSLRTVH